MFGICHLSTIPVRSTPADAAEMVTQLLLGDLFEVLQTSGSWDLIRILADSYEGWIDNKQYLPLHQAEFELVQQNSNTVSAELILMSTGSQGDRLLIPYGCNLPFYADGSFRIGDNIYRYAGQVRHMKDNFPISEIGETARNLLNVPYLWGGRSPLGMDCSGFVQLVYKLHGLSLPRDARQQATLGETIDFINEALPGDLAFFDNEEGRIIHVGILLAPDLVIHASGQVRTDFIDHHGIYKAMPGHYSHKLRLIKRLLPES
jgi:gamma-D-glutamyl-L-lysine dipeptidyl-peptidase